MLHKKTENDSLSLSLSVVSVQWNRNLDFFPIKKFDSEHFSLFRRFISMHTHTHTHGIC